MLKIGYFLAARPSSTEPSLLLSGASDRELRATAFRLAALLVERSGEERWTVQTAPNRAYIELYNPGDGRELERAAALLNDVAYKFLRGMR